jgi:hypothetical protein
LRQIKAKVLRLNDTYYKAMTIDNGEKDRYGDGEPSLFNMLRAKKKANTAQQPTDTNYRHHNALHHQGNSLCLPKAFHGKMCHNPCKTRLSQTTFGTLKGKVIRGGE